jgi:branched-chain amino acid transport system permease protein
VGFAGFGPPMLVGWLRAKVIGGLEAALTGIATLRLKFDYLATTTLMSRWCCCWSQSTPRD